MPENQRNPYLTLSATLLSRYYAIADMTNKTIAKVESMPSGSDVEAFYYNTYAELSKIRSLCDEAQALADEKKRELLGQDGIEPAT